MTRPKTPHERARAYAREALKYQDGKCIYCDEPLTPEKMTADHLIPKSAGGKAERGNIAACCKQCNTCKGSTMPFTFPAPSLPSSISFGRQTKSASRTC